MTMPMTMPSRNITRIWDSQIRRPASQFLPAVPVPAPAAACAASARARYVSGLGAQSGQDRSRGVYLCPFGHVLRYASDQGTCAGRPPACLGIRGDSAPQFAQRSVLVLVDPRAALPAVREAVDDAPVALVAAREVDHAPDERVRPVIMHPRTGHHSRSSRTTDPQASEVVADHVDAALREQLTKPPAPARPSPSCH